MASSDFLYCAGRSNHGAGLIVIDVTEPTSLQVVGFAKSWAPVLFAGVAVAGRTAFLAHQNTGVSTLDVSAPDSPTTLAEIPADAANAVAVFDSLALVAAGEELLVVPPRCTTADTTDSEPPDPEDPDAEPGVGVYYLRVVTNERTMVQSVVVAR